MDYCERCVHYPICKPKGKKWKPICTDGSRFIPREVIPNFTVNVEPRCSNCWSFVPVCITEPTYVGDELIRVMHLIICGNRGKCEKEK